MEQNGRTFGGRNDKGDFAFSEKHQSTRELVTEEIRLLRLTGLISHRRVGFRKGLRLT